MKPAASSPPFPVGLRDFARYDPPALCVPCPVCQASSGAPCLRPSGRRAATLHVARRDLMQLLFAVAHGSSARLRRGPNGWEVDVLPAPDA